MTEHIPSVYAAYRDRFAEVAAATDALGAATAAAGPLDDREQRLIKLGIAIGALAEGAVRSNVRKALDLGIDPAELHHVAMLAITTAGFPTAMAGLQWIDDVIAARAASDE